MSELDRYKDLRKTVTVANSKDGMLVIKAKCGGEIRRIPILNRELTYDELCFMVYLPLTYVKAAKTFQEPS
jgi:hypothetical protein